MHIVGLQSVITFRPGKNTDSVKICKNCKFFNKTKDTCKLFGNLNLVSGDLEFNQAAFERSQNGQCGPEAKYWYIANDNDNKNDLNE